MMGATNLMFSIFVPVGLALLLTPLIEGFAETALIAIAIISTLYRALDVGLGRD